MVNRFANLSYFSRGRPFERRQSNSKMETHISEFKFSNCFNYLIYLGSWCLETKDPFKNTLYTLYQLLYFLIYFVAMTLQLIDLWSVTGNVAKMTFNMCTSVIVINSTIKTIILLSKSEILNGLRWNLWQDYYKFDDEEDFVIKEAAYSEFKFVSKVFHVAITVFYPVCAMTAFYSYLWGPRELPFPAFFPIHANNSLQYNIAFGLECSFGIVILMSTVEMDLIVFSVTLQLAAQYKILCKNILKINEICDSDEEEGKREINEFLKKEKTRKYLKRIITRQLDLAEYTKNFENVFNKAFLIQIVGGAIVTIMNSLHVLKMTFTINAKIAYQAAYLTLIITDIYYNCSYMTMLQKEYSKIADAAYSTAWYEMDAGLQKYILMVILQAQKPPKITAGKIFLVDLNTFLGLLKSTYSWLMLIRQIENK